MNIVQKGLVYSGKDSDTSRSCAFPGISVLPGGRWICSFRAAPKKIPLDGQRVMLTWSDDEGSTWTHPISPFVPPKVDGKPGLFRCAYITPVTDKKIMAVLSWVDNSDPSLPFFNEETEGLMDTRIFIAESTDMGETWSEPELVEIEGFNMPVPITGPILLLGNGELACQFELNKHYYDITEWRHSSVLAFSKDRGKTWYSSSIVSSHPENRIFYWDQRPAVMQDGRILDLFWTFDRKDAKYLNIHGRESVDNGKNWTEIWDTGVLGQPAAPVYLNNGYIGMVYVDRTGSPVIKLRLSRDEGRIWPEDTELIIYDSEYNKQECGKKTMQDAWEEMGKFSVGLPATTRLENGDILVVFYAGPETDQTDIYWTRISGNIV
jgi:hypothetical protein